jgi:hypothetical protein
MRINTSSINKNNTLTLLILITLLTTILIRLDYVIPIMKSLLSYELEISLRLTSALYSILSIFISIISLKSFVVLTVDKYKKKFSMDNKAYLIYTFYFMYMLIISFILYIINYKSIQSLNIDYLVLVYLSATFISYNIGIYYILFKYEFKLDLNKTSSLTGKLCIISFILIYSSIFIGLRYGYLINFLENNFIFNKILCESSNGDTNNILNNLKDPNQDKISDSKINLSNASNISNTANTKASLVGNSNSNNLIVENSTISNVNTSPLPNSTNNQSAINVTASLKRTKEIYTSSGSGENNEVTQITVTDELSASFNNINNSNNSSQKSINNSNEYVSFIKKGFSLVTNPIQRKSLNSTPFRDSFSSSNSNFLGRNPLVRPKTPSISSAYSTDLPLRLNTNNLNNSNPEISPHTATTIKPSPITPSTITKNFKNDLTNFNIDKDLPKIPGDLNGDVEDLKINDNSLNSTNTKNNILRKVRSLPFLKHTYDKDLVIFLDNHWKSIGLSINNKNEIELPNNIKNLSDDQFKLNSNNALMKVVNTNMRQLFEDNPILDDKLKDKFWIEYDAKYKKNKGFVFIEKDNYNYKYEFIGVKNKFELVSYLNSDSHKIKGIFIQRNIVMKTTLQNNIKDQYLWSFSDWCTTFNRNIKF